MKVIIDGNSVFFKFYFAMLRMNLTNSQGVPTGAIYGFINYLNSLKKEYNYKFEDFIITFDNPSSKLSRKSIYPEYKDGRLAKDKDLYKQLETLIGLLFAEGFPILSINYYEADDLCYNLAGFYSNKGEEVIIISGDHDLLQGLSFGKVKMLLGVNKDKKIIDQEGFKDLYGFSIGNFLNYKALLGDSSDNIKGVKGVGKKSALKVINYLEENNLLLGSYFNDNENEVILKETPDDIKKIIVKILNEKEKFLLNRKVMKPLPFKITEDLINKNKNKNLEEADTIYELLEIKKVLIRD